MNFKVKTVTGETLNVGGQPLISDKMMKERYPELYEALAIHEKETKQLTLAVACTHILKMFNPDLNIDLVELDVYTCNEISEIYQGLKVEEQDKKKASIDGGTGT